MKKVTSLLLLAGVAAFGLVGCGDDTTGPEPQILNVEVTPSEVTVQPGDTAQVRVDFETQGDVGDADVQWASGNTSVATVSPTGDRTAEVVAQSSGTVTVTATVSSGNAPAQSNSAGVTVQQVEDATVSIGNITNQNGNPVDVSSVNGQINITINVDQGGEDVDQVSLLIDGEPVSTQEFTSANIVESDVSAQNDVEEITFNFRTDRLAGSTPDDVITPDNVDPDGNVHEGQFPNGEHDVSAQLTTADGTERQAAQSETLTFDNGNEALLDIIEGNTAVEPTNGTRFWGGTDVDVAATPLVYDGSGVSSITISADNDGGIAIDFGSGAGANVTDSDEPFVFTAAAADNGSVEDSPDNQDGDEQDIDIRSIRDADNVEVLSSFSHSILTTHFDWAAPDLSGGAIEVLLSGGASAISGGDYFSAVPASDFVLTGVSDAGVGGVYDAAGDFFQIDIVDGASPANILFEDVATTSELDENAPLGATENHARLASAQDRLGNTTDNSSSNVSDSDDFGIDFGTPETSNALPDGGTDFVFNGDASGTANELEFDLADAALANGETPSGAVHGNTTVTIVDGDGNVLVASGTTPTSTTSPTIEHEPPTTAAAQGLQVATFTFEDAARDPNTGTIEFTYVQDTEAPTFGALNPAPQSTATDATSVIQDIGGTIDDANVIDSAVLRVRVDGTDAQGSGSDGTCDPGSDYLLDPGAGEIDRNEIDLTDGTGSISFDETFEIEDPFPSGTGTVKYCFLITATDEALDNTGSPDGNSDMLNTESDIEWQN